MFEIFENYLRVNGAFTNEELAQIFAAATPKKIAKREIFHHEGEINRHKIFVCKGLLRCYGVTELGAEHIMRFGAENSWIIDHQSYQYEKLSRFNIDAIENSEVLLFAKKDVDKIMVEIPEFRAFSDRVKAETLDATHDRVLANISFTAEEKYNDFVETYPKIFERIPLHMVAAYLGISRETLSRVRRVKS